MTDDKTSWLIDLIKSSNGNVKKEVNSVGNHKFSGNAEDVIGPLDLEAGLYIVSYSFKATDDYPVFNISVENTKEEDDSHTLSAGGSNIKKGTNHKGKQKIRLSGGRYLIAVEVNDAANWQIELQNAT